MGVPEVLSYLFWPNPGGSSYGNLRIVVAIILGVALLLGAVFLSVMRRRSAHPLLRRLSGTWSAGALWFGSTALFLAIARVEEIQYLAMRVWWVAWVVVFAVFMVFQWRRVHVLWYDILPSSPLIDPRAKYLPRKHRSR